MASAYPQVIVTKTVNIDSVSWTAISSPIDANEIYCLVSGSAAVTFRTDSADPNTGKVVAAGSEYSPIGGGQTIGTGMKPRYPANQTLFFAQAASGTGPIIVTGLL